MGPTTAAASGVLVLRPGPAVYICDECVELCVEMLDGERGKRAVPGDN